MNRLRTTVDAGRTIKHKGTIQAQQLSQKAAVVEKYYHQGIITANNLLEALAAHFDDQKLDNFFQNAADEECKNQATGTETPTSSKYNCE